MRREELFPKYKPMATALAKAFSKKYRVPFGDLLDEAQGALGLACCTWGRWRTDKSFPHPGCKLTTWMYHSIYWRLLTHCTRERPRNSMVPLSVVTGEDTEVREHPNLLSRRTWRDRVLRDLSEDARDLVYIIICAPSEIAEDVATATCARGRAAVREYVLRWWGWPLHKLNSVWDEVRNAL